MCSVVSFFVIELTTWLSEDGASLERITPREETLALLEVRRRGQNRGASEDSRSYLLQGRLEADLLEVRRCGGNG
jgi:hypothetical protein